MTTSKVVFAALTALAIGIICAALVLGRTIENPKPYNMSQAAIITVNVDMFEITEKGIFLAGIEVETELDEQQQAELFYTREEIVVRIADNNRMSILQQDNENEFFKLSSYEQREMIKSVWFDGQDLFVHTSKGAKIQIEIEPRKTVYYIDLDGKSTKVKFNRSKGTLTVDSIVYPVRRVQKSTPVKIESSNLKIA